MDDNTILQRVSELTDEEQELEESRLSTSLTPERLERLQSIEIELDQCWDLLRQRRARRLVGLDPEEATVRTEDVVENYEE
jgi:dethiobiotin synthetase